MLEFNELCFGYDDNYLLENVSIKIEGNKIGLVGKNGVGKTTVLNLISGRIAPKKGEIHILGSSYFTIYDFNKYNKLTIEDFLMLVKPLKSFNNEKIDYYIELLNLKDYLGYAIGSLSKGTQKKIGILLTFLSNRQVLLIDEPFESIDKETNDNIIKELSKLDKQYIIVSHDIEYLKKSTEKIYEIRDKGLIEYD